MKILVRPAGKICFRVRVRVQLNLIMYTIKEDGATEIIFFQSWVMFVFSLLFFFVPSFSRWRLVCHVSLNKNTVIYFIIIYPVVVHPLYHQDMGSSMFWMTTQAIKEGLNFPPSPTATGKNSWCQLTEHLRLKWSVILICKFFTRWMNINMNITPPS